jgi:chromosome segregation ATPase
MAREATISQERVNAVADSIRASGAKPTARAVHQTLGSGSMATVLKYLQVWQAGQVRTEEGPVVLPASLQRVLVDFVMQEVASAKAGLQDELVAAQQSNSDLIAENERQASTINLQAEALDSIQAEKAELAGRLAQVESELSRAKDDVIAERQAAERARTELAKAELRLEALPRIEAEADRLRGELTSERTAKVAAEQAAAVANEKITGLVARLADGQTRITALEKKEQDQLTALETSEERERGLSDRLHEALGQLTVANMATAQAEEQGRKALERIAVLEKQIEPAKTPAKNAKNKDEAP